MNANRSDRDCTKRAQRVADWPRGNVAAQFCRDVRVATGLILTLR